MTVSQSVSGCKNRPAGGTVFPPSGLYNSRHIQCSCQSVSRLIRSSRSVFITGCRRRRCTASPDCNESCMTRVLRPHTHKEGNIVPHSAHRLGRRDYAFCQINNLQTKVAINDLFGSSTVSRQNSAAASRDRHQH